MNSTHTGTATALAVRFTGREVQSMKSQFRQLAFSKNGHRNIFISACSLCHSSQEAQLISLSLEPGQTCGFFSPQSMVEMMLCAFPGQFILKSQIKKKKACSFCLALSSGTFMLGPAIMSLGTQATGRGYVQVFQQASELNCEGVNHLKMDAVQVFKSSS